MKEATADDPSLKELKETIKSGWPETKSQTPANIQIYWNVRDELSEVKGVLLKNDRIIVPSSMRKEMLQRIHQGHMWIEKSKRRARDVLYWPGMNSQISDMISRCTICLQHQWQNTKKPMIPSRIPSKPCHRLVHMGQIWIPDHCWLSLKIFWSSQTTKHQKYHSHHLHQIHVCQTWNTIWSNQRQWSPVRL